MQRLFNSSRGVLSRSHPGLAGRLAVAFIIGLRAITGAASAQEIGDAVPNPSAIPNRSVKRVAVPPPEAVAAAEKSFEQAFGEQVRQAASDAQRAELAQRLQQLAAETTDDSERYVRHINN